MKEKQFKPMLAPNDKVDLDQIKYPLLASYKLDGIRCIFKDGEMLSRSLKPIRCKQLREKFKDIIELSKVGPTYDGEIYGHGLTFQQITHFVMTMDVGDEIIPEELKFYCFDIVDKNLFGDRVKSYNTLLRNFDNCVCVEQIEVNSKDEVEAMFESAINGNYEGLILKDALGPYKFGRGTIKQGLIYKIKPFKTYDLPVFDVFERFENTGESEINELGLKQKARHKDNLVETGIAAGFIVKYNGQDMKVTLTGNEEFRREIWKAKDDCIGRVIEFKAMEVGAKDVLRHPVFLRFREDK